MTQEGAFRFFLFLFFAGLYLLCTPGHFYTVDSYVSYWTTQSLVLEGSLQIAENRISVPMAEGGSTGRYGPLQMVLCVPLYVAGEFMERIWPYPIYVYRDWRVVFVATFNQWIGAAALVVFYSILRKLGYARKPCFAAACVFGFASPWWTYALDLFRQPLAGLLFLWAIAEALNFGRAKDAGSLIRFGAAVGLSITNRLTAVAAWPGLFVLLASRFGRKWEKKTILQSVGVIGVLLAVGIAAQIAVNYIRFDHWWGWAYENRKFRLGWLARNLPDLLLSPARGLLLFAPPLVLAVHGFLATWRKDRSFALALALMIAAKLLMFGTYEDYTGGMNPGPRYLIPIMAVLFLYVGVLICEEWNNRTFRYSMGFLAGLGFVVNGFNCLIPYILTLTFWDQIFRLFGQTYEGIPPWNTRVDLYDLLVVRWLFDGFYFSIAVYVPLMLSIVLFAWTRIRPLLREESREVETSR